MAGSALRICACGDSRKLATTFAPALAGKPGIHGRPELRLFVTHVRMNGAASSALAMPGGARSVTLVGLQLETWL